MKIDKRDMWFIGLIVAVVSVFISISGKEKTKLVPNDSTHQIAYRAAYKNAPGPEASFFKRAFFKADKKGAEVYCEPCHTEQKVPFPPNHPPKNRCLFCHKLQPLKL
ncbi:MAG: cytochrome C [Desulfuromonadales bacterium]|nr:cytochrome C [Desulfuromonadales bacterium]